MLAARGLATEGDPGDGALPSGRSLLADAALLLSSLTGDDAHRRIAEAAVAPALASRRRPAERVRRGAGRGIPSRGAARAARDRRPGRERASWATRRGAGGGACARSSHPSQAEAFASAGFELFASRGSRDGLATAYYCEHFVCALPVTTADELTALLAAVPGHGQHDELGLRVGGPLVQRPVVHGDRLSPSRVSARAAEAAAIPPPQ